MTRTLIIAITLLAFASSNSEPTFAQGKPVAIHGAGSSSCGKYVEVYDAYRPFMDGNAGGVVA